MIRAGDKVVLLADSAKFPGPGRARVCGPGEVDVVVTNGPVDTGTRSSFEEAGADVVTV
jgi:DeoR/GlpR family transcriptional regulator of sugar metabolism